MISADDCKALAGQLLQSPCGVSVIPADIYDEAEMVLLQSPCGASLIPDGYHMEVKSIAVTVPLWGVIDLANLHKHLLLVFVVLLFSFLL